MASNDPTETGGLFIGRRPGTAPLRYRDVPVQAGIARRRADSMLAGGILTLEALLLSTLWGPQPAGWLDLVHRLLVAPRGREEFVVHLRIVKARHGATVQAE